MDKVYDWDDEKNQKLILERNISFEEVVYALEKGRILGNEAHPNQIKYPDQKIFILALKDYVYYVPYVEDEEKIFLKTIIPSRKAKMKYGG